MQRTFERIVSYVFLVLTVHFLNGCVSQQVTPTTSSSKLTIDEYPLQYAPTTEPLSFIPVQGSQEEILAKHQKERSMLAPDNSMLFEERPAFSVQVGNENLVAFETYTDTVTNQGTFQKVTVKVLKDTQVIWSADAGDVSPINSLRGLWSSSDQWVLEIAHVTLDFESNKATLESVGEIIQGGKSLNERNKYDQTFGFQLIKGKPFYFFQKNGKIGMSYDGEQVLLEYDQIIHYQCCSASVLNPRIALSMVSFFAQRQGIWYYVEIGVFT